MFFFVDPDSMRPTLYFLECLGLDRSLDATGIFDVMTAAFQKHNLSFLIQTIILLALKDGLKAYTSPVDETLIHLFYLYKNSSKKYRELKNLYQLMKGQFKMYGDGVRPTKATGTRWIEHKVCAMERVVDKYGSYCQHLQHAITDTKKSKDKALLQGKFNKLVDAKILLCSYFFLDVLTPTKIFSLQTQNSNISIIAIVDCAHTTK